MQKTEILAFAVTTILVFNFVNSLIIVKADNSNIVDISGEWTGRWNADYNAVGYVTYHLTQTGNTVNGYVTHKWHSGYANYTVAGTVYENGTIVFHNSLTEKDFWQNWCNEVTWTGVIEEPPAKITGTYLGGSCKGTFTLYTTVNFPPNEPVDLDQTDSSYQSIPVAEEHLTDMVFFKATISDPNDDGIYLQVELRRLDEFFGEFNEDAGGFKESYGFSGVSEATCNAKDLIPGKYHWRARTCSVKNDWSEWVEFGNNDITEPDFIIVKSNPDINGRIREKIETRKIFHLNNEYPEYLLDSKTFDLAVSTVWQSFTDFVTRQDLTGEYDELYNAGLNFDYLGFYTLIQAGRFLDKGDIESAGKYLEKSIRYDDLSFQAFNGANQVFQDNLAAGIEIAKGIKNACQTASILGLKVFCPAAAEVVETVYLVVDIGVDNALYGKEEAGKNLITKVLIKFIFNEFNFDDLGGKTISDWIQNRVGKAVFPTIQKLFKTPSFQRAISKLIKETSTKLTSDAAEEVLQYILTEADKLLNVMSVNVQCPVELCVYDSNQNIAGVYNNYVYHNIPKSYYYNDTIFVYFPTGDYTYEISGTDSGVYILNVTKNVNGEINTIVTPEIKTNMGSVHRVMVNWTKSSIGEKAVDIQMDNDGDGVFEDSVSYDNLFKKNLGNDIPATSTPGFELILFVVTIALVLFWKRKNNRFLH